jgi:Mn-dependent DtxR family transcriptional regulator
MKKKTLSPREQECYDIIVEYYKETKVFPTHVYVADKMDVKIRQQVTAIFKVLAEKGWIKKTPRHGMYTM